MMINWSQIMKIFSVIVLIFNCGDAFFLNWGSSSEPAPTMKSPWQQAVPAQAYYYQHRYLQPQASSLQPQYTNPPTNNDVGQPSSSLSVPQPLPAIPIQVPLQAQLTPAANIHNVQLVPCLCPISPDDFDNKASLDVSYSQVNKNNNNNNNNTPQK